MKQNSCHFLKKCFFVATWANSLGSSNINLVYITHRKNVKINYVALWWDYAINNDVFYTLDHISKGILMWEHEKKLTIFPALQWYDVMPTLYKLWRITLYDLMNYYFKVFQMNWKIWIIKSQNMFPQVSSSITFA